LKPFAESVTAFARRYRRDIFYRTGWNVVLLQVGFAVVVLGIMLFALSMMYDEVVTGLISSITDSIAKSIVSGTAPNLDSTMIAYNLEYEKQRAMVLAGSGVLAVAATFGYLITRIALVPAGNALKSQKQFVGNVAHELRTPLSIIKTNTEVALFNERLDTDTQETLRSNIEELDRISDIINNLLSMNALLRPEKMEFSNVDMSPILERVASSLEDLAEHKRISIVVSKNDYCFVWGNASAIEQIVSNVVKNAINYSLVGGTVQISTEPNYRGQMDIIVEDSGVGIGEKDLDRIFEPFYRGDQSRNRASGGSGLGLAIVSELVKIHKGSISIKSDLGKGTIVTITLPCRKNRKEKEAGSGPGEIAIDFSK